MTVVDITIHQVQRYKYAATARRADGSVIQAVHLSSIYACIHMLARGLDAQTLNIYYGEHAHVTTPRADATRAARAQALADKLAAPPVAD